MVQRAHKAHRPGSNTGRADDTSLGEARRRRPGRPHPGKEAPPRTQDIDEMWSSQNPSFFWLTFGGGTFLVRADECTFLVRADERTFLVRADEWTFFGLRLFDINVVAFLIHFLIRFTNTLARSAHMHPSCLFW